MLQRNLRLILSVLVSLILITSLTSCSGVKKLEIFKTEVEREKGTIILWDGCGDRECSGGSGPEEMNDQVDYSFDCEEFDPKDFQ